MKDLIEIRMANRCSRSLYGGQIDSLIRSHDIRIIGDRDMVPAMFYIDDHEAGECEFMVLCANARVDCTDVYKRLRDLAAV